MFPWQEGKVGVCLAVKGALRSRFPLWQPISCPEPWDSIPLLHLGVRVALRNVEVALSCALVSAADAGSACP